MLRDDSKALQSVVFEDWGSGQEFSMAFWLGRFLIRQLPDRARARSSLVSWGAQETESTTVVSSKAGCRNVATCLGMFQEPETALKIPAANSSVAFSRSGTSLASFARSSSSEEISAFEGLCCIDSAAAHQRFAQIFHRSSFLPHSYSACFSSSDGPGGAHRSAAH